MEEIIAKIAAKHGIVVGKDDPILVLQTINMHLLQEASAQQTKILAEFQEKMEEVSQRWSSDAQLKAEKTLTAALNASRDAMSKTMKEGADLAASTISKEVEKLAVRIEATTAQARGIALLQMIGGGFVLIASAVALWACYAAYSA